MLGKTREITSSEFICGGFYIFGTTVHRSGAIRKRKIKLAQLPASNMASESINANNVQSSGFQIDNYVL